MSLFAAAPLLAGLLGEEEEEEKASLSLLLPVANNGHSREKKGKGRAESYLTGGGVVEFGN